MFKRIWDVVSVTVGVWSIYRTLNTLGGQKNEMFAEFYKSLSPDEKKTWTKIFGMPPIAEVEPFALPQLPKVNVPTTKQLDQLKASV